jgi:hypothetical protein
VSEERSGGNVADDGADPLIHIIRRHREATGTNICLSFLKGGKKARNGRETPG